MNDHDHMRRALELAAQGLGRTRPNPVVGCVIVRNGEVVGEGFHRRAGLPHAEVEALNVAGERARGATAYVNLEPCAHHGRTPPCADALIAAGIARVVVGVFDPNPRVSGEGIRRLEAAGVEVVADVCGDEARRINRPFFKHIRERRPWVVAKWAMTLDGKIATRTRHSQWITDAVARQEVHHMRNRLDAILVGAGTVRADDPLLTCRIPDGRDPVRVVLDSRATLSPDAHVFDTPGTLLFTTVSPPADHLMALHARGAEVVVVPAHEGRVALPSVLDALGVRDINSLLVEGGSEVLGAFFDQRLVDEIACFIAPKIAGGTAAPGPIGGLGVAEMVDALRLHHVATRALGPDILLTADVEDACSPD